MKIAAIALYFFTTFLLGLSFAGAQEKELVRFTAWEQLNSVEPSLQSHFQAVHQVETSNGPCSVTAISNTGHYLTARHCLQHCLIRSGAFERKNAEEGMLTYFELSSEALKTATCPGKLDGVDVTLKMEATSLGLIIPMEENSFRTLMPEFYKQAAARGYTSEGDFAIFSVVGNTQKTACLPLAQSSQNIKTRLRTLGYPSKTERPDGFNSSGEGLYYSQGYQLSSISENECLHEDGFPQEKIPYIQGRLDRETSFMTSLDAIYGSSGTGAINIDNQVVGVLVSMYDHSIYTRLVEDRPENRYCEGSAKALRAETIREQLRWQGFDESQLICE